MKRPVGLFIAADTGPRETLEPIAQCWGMALETSFADSTEFWITRLEQAGAALVVTGTSDSANGRAIEAAARVAARRAGLPLAAVEDYPGNYAVVEGGEADLLLVESGAAIDLAQNRLAGQCPRLMAISPARFDAMRWHSASARQAMRKRWEAGRKRREPAAILWLGQPETEDALATLDALLPAVHAGGWHLLFRAHPRDAGYMVGAYAAIAQALDSRFEDVTALGAAEVFALAPRLVVTQFSSMVTEAGFHGIPSLCLLFPGAGMNRLNLKKGYQVPLACTAGAVGLCVEPAQLPNSLHRLLEDEQARSDLMSRFDAYFQTGTTTGAASATALETLLGQQGHRIRRCRKP
jgi:hypothetical protein